MIFQNVVEYGNAAGFQFCYVTDKDLYEVSFSWNIL